MEKPDPPIIVLRHGDDALSAFPTTEEAVEHLGTSQLCEEHRLSGDLTEADFFDSRARRLEAVIKPRGGLSDLVVVSDERHADHVRERVRRRSRAIQEAGHRPEDGDDSPLKLADEAETFEELMAELAGVLNGPSEHTAGWWHNTFGH